MKNTHNRKRRQKKTQPQQQESGHQEGTIFEKWVGLTKRYSHTRSKATRQEHPILSELDIRLIYDIVYFVALPGVFLIAISCLAVAMHQRLFFSILKYINN